MNTYNNILLNELDINWTNTISSEYYKPFKEALQNINDNQKSLPKYIKSLKNDNSNIYIDLFICINNIDRTNYFFKFINIIIKNMKNYDDRKNMMIFIYKKIKYLDCFINLCEKYKLSNSENTFYNLFIQLIRYFDTIISIHQYIDQSKNNNTNNISHKMHKYKKEFMQQILNIDFCIDMGKKIPDFLDYANKITYDAKINTFYFFFEEYKRKGSPYNPISNTKNRQIGDVFDGLEIQWDSQNLNKYENYKFNNEGSNKDRFLYLIEHWEKVKELINKNKGKDKYKNILAPLEFLGDIDNIKLLLVELCNTKTYLYRAFLIEFFLYGKGYDILGKSLVNNKENIVFTTIETQKYNNMEEQSFLTILYFLYNILKLDEKSVAKKAANNADPVLKAEKNARTKAYINRQAKKVAINADPVLKAQKNARIKAYANRQAKKADSKKIEEKSQINPEERRKAKELRRKNRTKEQIQINKNKAKKAKKNKKINK